MTCQSDAPTLEMVHDGPCLHEGAVISKSTLDEPACAVQETKYEGGAKPNIIDGGISPSTLEQTPALALVYSEQSQCLQTHVSSSVDPSLNIHGDISGRKGRAQRSLKWLQQETDLLQIAIWVVASDFRRLQLLEPIVGDAPTSYPPIIDDYGLKGKSIYTAFFDHLDMGTFICRKCGHTVEGDLEIAIAHQRAVHFLHEPYRCHALNDQCGCRFASPSMLHAHQANAGH